VELRQVTYFVAVVRHGGFTRAAERLRIAQPAISAQISRLEAELDVRLFTRTTRRVQLTTAGELFLVRAQRILDELAAARADLAGLAAVLRGRVVVGATDVLGGVDLPRALRAFHTGHPGVDLVLRSGLVGSLLAGLDAGEVDLVLGPVHDDPAGRYVAVPLSEETVVAVTGPGGPWADRRRLRLGELRDEPFVSLPAGSGLRSILDDAAAAAGFVAHVPFEASGPGGIRSLVHAGLGVALMAESAARSPGPPVVVHPLHDAPAHPPIGVLHRRDRQLGPAASALRAHVLAQAGTLR
jgi:LysR family transcriptional regulator, transcription activator of glutamate synthase operon